MIWDGEFIGGVNKEINLFLSHESNDDTCKAYPPKDIGFNLNPIKDKCLENYGNCDSINVNFYDYEGKVHEFNYSINNQSMPLKNNLYLILTISAIVIILIICILFFILKKKEK